MLFDRRHEKCGGRKRGTPDKRTIALREMLDRVYEVVMPQLPNEIRDMTPLEALLLCMRWSIAAQDREGILAAASLAAPYCHPRLNSVDMQVRNPDEKLSDEELAEQIRQLEERIALAENGEAEPLPGGLKPLPRHLLPKKQLPN
jgi:hypothetical protein